MQNAPILRIFSLTLISALALISIPVSAQEQEEGGDECRFSINQDSTARLSAACEEEIAAASTDEDRAEALFRLAYALNENDGALGALDLLDRALLLAPNNAGYLHERGYTRGDLGLYAEALEDLDRVLEIDPSHLPALNERGWARQTLGDFEGALADYARFVDLGGDEGAILLSRAANYIWLGRLEKAEADLLLIEAGDGNPDFVTQHRALIARIRAYEPDGDPAKLCTLAEMRSDPSGYHAVFDACTRAFLDESDPAIKAGYLTARSPIQQAIKNDPAAGLEDMQLAVGLDPEPGRRHFNYGFSLLQISHSWAARNAFDKALDRTLPSDQARALALAGRGQANYNLGSFDAAFQDVGQSLELEFNPLGLAIMGRLAFNKGDTDAAKDFWLEEWRLFGARPGLSERLASVGVTDPKAELSK